MTSLIKGLNLPWKDKPIRGAFLRIIGRLGDVIQEDVRRINRAFYPFLCEASMLGSYGQAFGMPRLAGESDQEFRMRLATAGKFLQRSGERGLVNDILDQNAPGRWEIFEAPRMSFRVGFSPMGSSMIARGNFLIIRVKNLTHAEKHTIYSLLDSVLDPGIRIDVLSKLGDAPRHLTVENIRLSGGGRSLEKYFEGATVRLMPDDGFRIGQSPLGLSPVWEKDTDESTVIIWPNGTEVEEVRETAGNLFAETVNWGIVGEIQPPAAPEG